MKKIRVGQIGTWHDHAGDLILTLKKLPDIYEITGVGIPEGDVIYSPALYADIRHMTPEELLEQKPDAVLVETFEGKLTKYALMAAEKGIHVHMDKPGGMALDEFEQLIRTVKARGIVFHTGYMYRYNPAVQKLKREVDEGKLGRVYSVEAHMDCIHPTQKRQWLSQFPGGMMFYLGCHLIDLICYIQGFPKEVIPYNCATGSDGVTADDCGFAVLRYDNGISFAKTCANELGGFMRRQLVVCGDKGTVQLLPFEDVPVPDKKTELITGVRESFASEGAWQWLYKGNEYKTAPFDRYISMMKDFAELIRGEKTSPFTPDYELELYKTVLRACGV